jgi:hypothetical protein
MNEYEKDCIDIIIEENIDYLQNYSMTLCNLYYFQREKMLETQTKEDLCIYNHFKLKLYQQIKKYKGWL